MFNWLYQIFNGTRNIENSDNMGNVNGNVIQGNVNGITDYGSNEYQRLYNSAMGQVLTNLYGNTGTPIGNDRIQGNTIPDNTKYTNDISQMMNIQYHDTEEQIRANTDTDLDYYIVYDTSGNPIKYPSTKIQGSINYYSPGAYTFGSASYVPNYEDSIYLSKLTGLSTTKPIYDMASMQKGFCKYYEAQPDKIEQVCNRLNKNGCASTSCCVLLGGSKCVAGNENGPKFKTNYGDVFVRNKDYYYYQSKCYGNCP
jgi:hypothetical protein